MSPEIANKVQVTPIAPMGLLIMPGCEEMGEKIDDFLVQWRNESAESANYVPIAGYSRETFRIQFDVHRFGSGEAKAVIRESVRGLDLFIVCDCFNYGMTYRMYNQTVPMSPDDHYQDLKRVIAAVGGKARRISVIMPMLYEGRQHKRSGRESLDCAIALQELERMGVENLITFDAHDARVQNAIPLSGFESVQPTYQMMKAMVRSVPDLRIDRDHMMIISPDEGGMYRAIYYSTVLGLNLGMFYKRRDYSRIVNGRNPIVAHEFLGDNIEGKDVIVVDDMISSGDSVLEIARKLRAMKAKRIFYCITFGLFCEGLESFDKAYEEGNFNRIFTTNLTYQTPELLARPWYTPVDMSKYVSYIIETLNRDVTVSELLNPVDRIERLLEVHRLGDDDDTIEGAIGF